MKKVLVSLLVGMTLCGGLFGCGEETVSKAKYDEVLKSNEQLVENNENLVKDKQELQAKIDSAKDYFELDENEKEIVDTKIKEVNEATEAQIAEEKAKKEEEEKARKEAEEEAKRQEEEAKRQEEEAKKAEEEEAKRQEEERIAQEQAALQPYRDATAYIQQEVDKSGYSYDVHLNESTKTIEIVFDTGDTSISDLRAIGYDDETIKMAADFESCYSAAQLVATTCYSEVVAIYGMSDIKITMTFKLAGEPVCTFNQNGECVYSIF